VTVVAAADFIVQFTALPLYHFLHNIEVSVQLFQEEIALAHKYLLQAGKIRDSGRNFLALLQDVIDEAMFLCLRLAHNLA